MAYGPAMEASGSFAHGGRTVRSASGKDAAAAEGLAAKSQAAEAKAEMLQGALASMRSKASAVVAWDVTLIASYLALLCLLLDTRCSQIALIALHLDTFSWYQCGVTG